MAVKGCHRRTNLFAPRLLESYCEACGLLVAASPWPALLDIAENVHICPVHGHYEAGSSPPKPPQSVQQRLGSALRKRKTQ